MGAGTFFSKVASNPLFQSLDLPGSHKYQDTIENRVGLDQGPYTGVAPTLAAANAGYRAGGPGANGTQNDVYVGSNAAGLGHGPIGGLFGTINQANAPFEMYAPTASKLGGAVSGAVYGGGGGTNSSIGPVNTVPNPAGTNPYVNAARNATMTTGY